MPLYNLHDIASMTGGKLIHPHEDNISRILIDSRKVFTPEQTLFIALKGRNHDGHLYIKDLYQRGVRAFVVERYFSEYTSYPDACFISVTNALTALQQLAARHRQTMPFPVLGITGSNGKTIVKEWITQLIAGDKTVIRSPRSYNSQVGVPLSLWLLEKQADLGIIEAGISHPGEMSRLAPIIAPDLGLITNIGQAHQENFLSIEEKLREKLHLFEKTSILFYCKDHTLVDQLIKARYPHKQTICWGTQPDCDLYIENVTKEADATIVRARWQGDNLKFNIPFSDKASYENAIHAVLIALHLNIDRQDLMLRTPKLQSVGMRLEQKEGINNCLLIDDAYNSDFTSLEIALDFLIQQGHKKGLSKTLILSDILQAGIPEQALYAKVKALIKEKGINRLIGIGPAITKAFREDDSNIKCYLSTGDFLKDFALNKFQNEAILIKGSRSFTFERITTLLEKRRHKTVCEVNLNALAHNLNFFRGKLKPQTRLLAMVKAFSYGSGSFEIANLLQHQKVDYLGVAFADEGMELRAAGINVPIMVMNPEPLSFPLMIQYDLEPEIYSLQQLHEYARCVEREGLDGLPIHIKIDTGMYRSGFMPDQIPQISEKLKLYPHLYVKSAFSHLAGSDEAQHDTFTELQIERFTKATDALKAGLGYPFMRHILNSAGIERFPQAQFEMVRLGIGMYGISPENEAHLLNVISLKSYISQIKEVPAFETIGYGRKGVLKNNSRIAVIPIGYADGLDRHLSNEKGKVMINGRFVPIIGNICMDMCMADITNISAEEGDEVVIFGDDYPVSQIAKILDTIPYEVLTSISRRVKRIYFSE
ncbi:bifunctional UDP-N-acetylmuramoyl-tripeptide:D-alanyl-D-alanine ligase/alanine racemase [Marinilabiliaceae bacterium JC017]|nr:bifunctional UDP-N-acetylmuramoyl-tripeptide:D-alanyl-D-alanine ligase/alanine racemase [Marinilabiliaceae bacterium JC017]